MISLLCTGFCPYSATDEGFASGAYRFFFTLIPMYWSYPMPQAAIDSPLVMVCSLLLGHVSYDIAASLTKPMASGQPESLAVQ